MNESVLESLLEKAKVDENVEIKYIEDNFVSLTNNNAYIIHSNQSRKEAMINICLEIFGDFDQSFLSRVTGLPKCAFYFVDNYNISYDEVEQLLNAVNLTIEDFVNEVAQKYEYKSFLSDYEEELNLNDGYYAYRVTTYSM